MNGERPPRISATRGGAGPAAVLLGAILLGVAACGERHERAEGAPAYPDRSGADPSPAAPEQPAAHATDGEGHVRIVPDDPVVASSWGSWTVEWVAGPSGLPTGGAVVLQVSPFWGWSPPQTLRAGFAGFTTAHASRGGVHLEVIEGGVPSTILAHVAEGALAPGDTVRFVYGDSASGGPGSLARADRYAEAFEELLIKTDGNGDGYFVAPEDQPTLRILPGPPARLAVSGPVVVAPGVVFETRVSALDGLDSRTTVPPGTLTVVARPLATGTDAAGGAPDTLHHGSKGPGGSVVQMRIDRPGLFRLEAVLAGEQGTIAGRNDLLLVEKDSGFEGILWGDIHCHSALSDGTGAPEDLYTYAREVAGLDVCAVTDHDAHGLYPLADGGAWDTIRAATEAAYEPGAFVTLLGYEWTSWTWGHRNVYYPGAEGEVFAFPDPQSDTPEELWERIAPFGGMTIPHHPGGGPVPVDWSVPSPEESETVVEICSIHGSSEAWGVERGIYRPVRGAMVRDALAAGHDLGILASGDTHDAHPGRRTAGAPVNGLAAFRAAERTREAVWAALRERGVYGTSGPRILLSTEWGGHAPGAKLAGPPAGPLTVEVCAPEPIELVEVIGPTGTVASSYGGGRRAVKTFFAEGAPDARWVYVRVALADGEIAWESPYWLAEEAP